MSILNDLQDLTPNQRNVVIATFLGWTLDAFAWGIIPFIRTSVAMHAISGNGSQIEAGSGEKISDRITAPGSG